MRHVAATLVVTVLLFTGIGVFAALFALGWWRHRSVVRRARKRIGYYS